VRFTKFFVTIDREETKTYLKEDKSIGGSGTLTAERFSDCYKRDPNKDNEPPVLE
jgi:hypothetical protein